MPYRLATPQDWDYYARLRGNRQPLGLFMSFTLHPILQQDTFPILELPLCLALLMNDSRFPWIILVPKRSNVKEIHDLSLKDQHQLLHEITKTSRFAKTFFAAHKMNIAALGNAVPDLHIHIIARKENDFAWPKAVWGIGERIPYEEKVKDKLILEIAAELRNQFKI